MYDTNASMFSGTIVTVVEDKVIGEDLLLVEILLELVIGDKTKTIHLKSFGDMAERVRSLLGKRVLINGRYDSREYEGRWYSSMTVNGICTDPNIVKQKPSEEQPPPDYKNTDDMDVPF